MRIYFSPEGTVYVHQDGALAYHGTAAEFEGEAGVACPALPPGMVAMEYRKADGVLVYYDAKQNAFPVEGAVAHETLDPVLDNLPALQAAADAREQAKVLARQVGQLTDETLAAARLSPAISENTIQGVSL